jgi:hypothetical protein
MGRFKIRFREDGKQAIFDENGKMVSPEWFDTVYLEGLIDGESPYYYIARKNSNYAIFDVYGYQISDWFDDILPKGLLKDESDYYIACNGNTCAVYHRYGQKVSDDFPSQTIWKADHITFNDRGFIELKGIDGELFIPFKPFRREEIIDYTKLLNI